MLAVYWSFLAQNEDIFVVCMAGCWPYVGRMLAVCWPYVGRMLAVCWPYVGRMFAV